MNFIIVKYPTILLAGIMVLLVAIFVVVLLNYTESQKSRESMQYEQLQIDRVIQTFKDHYSNYEITEYLDSDNIIWKYKVETSYANIELIIGNDRVILRSFDKYDENMMCMIVNPYPKDVLDWCPPKW